jgi:hypothetical protein
LQLLKKIVPDPRLPEIAGSSPRWAQTDETMGK